MPEYTLRNVDPLLWSRFTERANREGWPIRALIVGLLDSYASGECTPTAPLPGELPQFGWLRAHYREVAKQPDFAGLDVGAQWQHLFNHVLDSPAGGSWNLLNQVPTERRSEIVRWLQRTSSLPIRQLLTLRAIAHISEGPDQQNRRAFQYEVLGLPDQQQAWVADFNGGWRILRVVDGHQGEWGDPHLAKEDALETLAQALDHRGV